MKIWIISWKYLDNSGSGVLNTAYMNEAYAKATLDLLASEITHKSYELHELNTMQSREMPEKPIRDDAYHQTQYPKPPWFDLIGAPGTPLKELNLTVRTEACLKADGLETVEQLLLCPASILLRIPNLGRKSLKEIEHALAARGMELKK